MLNDPHCLPNNRPALLLTNEAVYPVLGSSSNWHPAGNARLLKLDSAHSRC